MKNLFINLSFFLSLYIIPLNLLAQVKLDSYFGNLGIVTTATNYSSEIYTLTVQTDGKIVVAGNSGSHIQIARYNYNGTLDESFGIGGLVNTSIDRSGTPFSTVIQTDGKILIAGYYSAGTATQPKGNHSFIARYNSNGILDDSFSIGGIFKNPINNSLTADCITSMALQKNGKIVAAGQFGEKFLLMRLNENGTLDNEFGANGIRSTSVDSIASIQAIILQSDEKIVAAGTSGTSTNYKFTLARYNTDGSADGNFGVNGIVSSDIIYTDVEEFNKEAALSLALQSGGKMIVAGYAGNSGTLARYNTDGNLDTSFGVGGIAIYSTLPEAKSIAIQDDDKILVIGNKVVSAYNSGFALARFDIDGNIDEAFGSSGMIISDITPGNDYAQCIAIQSNQKILVAGSSRASTTHPSNFTLIRFNADLTNVPTFRSASTFLKIYPNPANDFFLISSKTDAVYKVVIIDILGKTIYENEFQKNLSIDVSAIPKGIYFVRSLNTDNNSQSISKVVIQ